MEIIPLNKLSRSDDNVRKTEIDADIVNFADDIEAHGLLQNLQVKPAKKKGHFEVTGGGRRFLALSHLVETGRLAKDWGVPCKIVSAEQAVSASLAENIQRVAMNPADEFQAFQTIIDQSEGEMAERIEACAKRFGTTAAHVKGRLRLSGLHPDILEALRTNVIGLGAAIAYASVDDHELQKTVFEKQSKVNYKPHDPESIRWAMKDVTYSAETAEVKYVGLEAYIERGGRVDNDIFTTDAEQRVLDTKLINDMVKEKFEIEKPTLIAEYGLKDARFTSASHNTPKIADYESKWVPEHQFEELKASGAEMIGIFYVAHGGKLARSNNVMVPAAPPEPKEAPRDWAAEREAEKRQRGIMLEAFRLAFPKAEDTAFSERIWLPGPTAFPRFEEDAQQGVIYLTAQIRISREELNAQMAAGEIKYDEALEIAAKIAAEREARRVAALEEAEKLQAEIRDCLPPVIEIDAHDDDPSFFFAQKTGIYTEHREIVGDLDDYEGMTYEDVEELLGCETVLRYWSTVEAFEEAIAEAA